MRSLLLVVTLALAACATTPGPDLEDCLRGTGAAHAERTWSDPMDTLITQAIDDQRASFLCPASEASLAAYEAH